MGLCTSAGSGEFINSDAPINGRFGRWMALKKRTGSTMYIARKKLRAMFFSDFARIAISAAGEQDLEGRFSL
jgi:hypothetical protein